MKIIEDVMYISLFSVNMLDKVHVLWSEILFVSFLVSQIKRLQVEVELSLNVPFILLLVNCERWNAEKKEVDNAKI